MVVKQQFASMGESLTKQQLMSMRDSLAMLESTTRFHSPVVLAEELKFRKATSATPLRLDVKLRFGRLLIMTGLVVVAILVLVITFNQGVELRRFPVGSKTEAEKTEILDDYNSYSGTIASMVGRPLEIFAALLVQVIIVRCAAPSMLRPENSTRAWIATLAMSALTGYLLNNGLNALNVQFRSLEIHPVIAASDVTTGNSIDVAPISTKSAQTFTISENVSKNNLTNTVLRNLVFPPRKKAPLNCPWPTDSRTATFVPDDMLQYGMPQRDWYARFLSEALESQRLRVEVNVTSNAMVQRGDSENLPMQASRAANLVMNGLFLAGTFLPIVSDASYLGPRNPNARIVNGVLGSAALMAGILPNDTKASENAQRDWVLREGPKLFAAHIRFKDNSTLVGLKVDFTRTQITPSISFEAVTFEAELGPVKTSLTVNKTSQCGPWPALCQFAKPATFADINGLYEPPMQIQAFATCLDASGSESLKARVFVPENRAKPPTNIVVDCSSTSNSSMLVVSVGRRLVADSIEEQGDKVVVTKLRKIYSFTVGRLGWELEDLSKQFNATCKVEEGCMGLRLNLSNIAIDMSNQDRLTKNEQLIVGGDSLPLRYVFAPTYDYYSSSYNPMQQRSTTLVQVCEPPAPRQNDAQYDVFAGDLLLPHNIRDIRWKTNSLWTSCPAQIEDRLQLVIKSHMYIEESLQPAYTAATFFLLQYGVVRKRVMQNSRATTLNFDGNLQDIAVWISVPKLNAWLTLAGCGLLVGCLLTAIFWAPLLQKLGKEDPLDEITAAHVIARVMLDEGRFPPIFLKRYVKVGNEPTDVRDEPEPFQIETMTLSRQPRQSQANGGAGLIQVI